VGNQSFSRYDVRSSFAISSHKPPDLPVFPVSALSVADGLRVTSRQQLVSLWCKPSLASGESVYVGTGAAGDEERAAACGIKINQI
jgi:hypothetical protein